MRKAVVFKGIVGIDWMIQSQTVWVSGRKAVLEESVGAAMETKQMGIRAQSQSS